MKSKIIKAVRDAMKTKPYTNDEFINLVDNVLASMELEPKHVHPPCKTCGEYPCVCGDGSATVSKKRSSK